jgi:hypothetical protein
LKPKKKRLPKKHGEEKKKNALSHLIFSTHAISSLPPLQQQTLNEQSKFFSFFGVMSFGMSLCFSLSQRNACLEVEHSLSLL